MKKRRHSLFAVLLLSVLTVPGFAQNYSLTPQQEAMLNQLPPAQRQQALSALRQLQQGDAGTEQLQSTLVEPITQPSNNDVLQSVTTLDPDPTAGPGSRLIVNFTVKSDLSRDDQQALTSDPALQSIEGSQFYVVDSTGELAIPGIGSFNLLGLTGAEIRQRLAAEPVLGVFDVDASLLGEGRAERDQLTAFGYDFFESPLQSFAPVMSGPVPPDYVLGPGDSVRVQLFGNVNGIYEVEVTRDGVLNLPELGPMTVAGLMFSDFRKDVNNRVNEMLIGTQVSVTMGQLRSIRLFVLGDVNQPGSYVASSMTTMSGALYSGGGVSRVGTLRNIELKRNGEVVSRLDLYDLLLNGDNSNDARLQPGDVVFVPPVGPQISIIGAVKRPGIYEIGNRTSVGDVIELAGGLADDAYPDGVRVERIGSNNERRIVNLDLTDNTVRTQRAKAGDKFDVPQILPELEASVSLQGHVHRPGAYEWTTDMRLSNLVRSESDLKPGADTGYVLIRREDADTRRVEAVSTNLSDALRNPASAANLRLEPKDRVYVFSLALGRQRVVDPLLEELELQARFDNPFGTVSVVGEVRAPGKYPLEPGMRVSDLIRAGGNLDEEAYALKAEVARYSVIDGEYRDAEIIDINLASVLRGDETADIALQAHDNLRISGVPDWDQLWSVTLEGEVRFPGAYRIREGETLSDILQRAGGLTEEAFPAGSVFLRESLRQREQDQIDQLAGRLEADLASLSLQQAQDASGGQTMSKGRQLLDQLRSTEAVGRLVIDLESVVDGLDDGTDVALRDGDRLLVPKQAQEVTVIGETQQNTSHLFQPGLSRKDYISMSGGLTRRADKKLIYVVRANGAIEAGRRSNWFGRNRGVDIMPGDTIVVPLDTDRVRPLTLWANVTQILYQAAIAIAAVNSFE
ncbi:MAG: SLBB domain-containing protein [Woeseiaceae bacterium]|nr:SLBB domain-containing protein [Woeseiaceae bacterium]